MCGYHTIHISVNKSERPNKSGGVLNHCGKDKLMLSIRFFNKWETSILTNIFLKFKQKALNRMFLKELKRLNLCVTPPTV